MLDKFIPQLIVDLELGSTTLASGVPGSYTIPLEQDLSIILSTMPQGFEMKSTVASVPAGREEQFFTRAMLGNLFGQGTKDGVLGLTPDGNKLTLTLIVDFPVSYKDFRDMLEDFINVIDLWRDEARSFAAEAAAKKP